MTQHKLDDDNEKALRSYCGILLSLRKMLATENPNSGKKDPVNSPIRRVIAATVRLATHSAHSYGYSDSGKLAAHFISKGAAAKLESGNNTDLVCEHVIPVGVLNGHIVQGWDKWNVEHLMACFRHFSVTAVITKEEDAQINRAGLRSKMPEGFSGLSDTCDKFARYNHKVDGKPLILLDSIQETHRAALRRKARTQ